MQYSPRCDAAKRGVPKRGVPSVAILFALKIFLEKLNNISKSHLMSLKMKQTCPNDNDGKVHSA